MGSSASIKSVYSSPGQPDTMIASESLPPIRFIHFEEFRNAGSMPRYPENKNICTNLKDIDRNNAFIVYISHSWLRGWSGAEGWDGRPHPDTAQGCKYDLCVSGVEKAWKRTASGMSDCYVWLDYGCLDQDGGPSTELKQLDIIMRYCDCIFTPIHGLAELTNQNDNIYENYKVAAWNAEKFGYVNRGWCRVEMFYAANIPYDGDETRVSKFSASLRHHTSNHRRPHLLYGTLEHNNSVNPQFLPPLQNAFFNRYHPSKGKVTIESDKNKILELVEQLKPYMVFTKEGYIGEKKNGKYHGKGIYRFASGDEYEGVYRNGKMHGKGIYRCANGDVYRGKFNENKMHGKGIYRFSDGNVYEGDFSDGKIHGKGIYTFVSGEVYEGDYCDGKRHGKGIYKFSNGEIYEGDYCDDKMHGKGIYKFADASVYKGEWCDGKMI